MMSIKEMLTSKCAGIILREARMKGRLTIISDESGINRKYFNRKLLRMLRFHRVVGLLYCTASWMSRMTDDRGQVRVIFLRTELFPYLFPSDAPAGALMRPTLATGLMLLVVSSYLFFENHYCRFSCKFYYLLPYLVVGESQGVTRDKKLSRGYFS